MKRDAKIELTGSSSQQSIGDLYSIDGVASKQQQKKIYFTLACLTGEKLTDLRD